MLISVHKLKRMEREMEMEMDREREREKERKITKQYSSFKPAYADGGPVSSRAAANLKRTFHSFVLQLCLLLKVAPLVLPSGRAWQQQPACQMRCGCPAGT